jgi:hypothetical protein
MENATVQTEKVQMTIEMVNGEVVKQETITSSSTPEERLVFLAKQREAIIDQLKAVDEELEKALVEVGMDKMIQDPATKVVYQVVKPKGRFVQFKDIDYIRTRKAADEKGDLSMEKAMAAGFDLGDLGPKNKKKA